jgi:hypothetical protein
MWSLSEPSLFSNANNTLESINNDYPCSPSSLPCFEAICLQNLYMRARKPNTRHVVADLRPLLAGLDQAVV